MTKGKFNLLKRMIPCIKTTNEDRERGIYHIKSWFGGKLCKVIGIKNALQVKELTVSGKINLTDFYFILHMDNLEILNLKDATYIGKKQNATKLNQLRRSLVKNKRHLREIWFPDSMRFVPDGLFQDCTTLKYVVLPTHIRTIGDHAFYNCGIEKVVIPASVASVGANAFDNCQNLEKVQVKDSKRLLMWKGTQFNNCPSLQEIYLGRNSIFEYALSMNATLGRLVLGKHINNLNFDIQHVIDMVCLMKKPPHKSQRLSAENVLVEKNFNLFWLHPQWNLENLCRKSC